MTVIDDFLGDLSAADREALLHIRKLTLEIAPDGEQVISYGMPVIRHKGMYLIGFCAFKNHLSIFPGSEAIGEIAPAKLKDFKTAKGTVQFTPEKPIPDDVVREIIKLRKAAIDDKKP